MHGKFACILLAFVLLFTFVPQCPAQGDEYDDLFLSEDDDAPPPPPAEEVVRAEVEQQRDEAQRTTQEPEVSEIEKKKQQLQKQILPKLFDAYPTLTREEFVVYLEVVEATNPLKTWQQIATKLHQKAYPEDADRKVAGVSLFVDGPENEGYDKVQLPGRYVPKFVIGEDGKKIDIAHAYAGLRAGLNRGSTKTWWMTRVNTDWGDSYQVAGERLGGTGRIIGGIFTFNGDRISRGASQWSNATNYKTKPQIRGNQAAIVAQTFLTDRKGNKLSEAFTHVLWPQKLERKKPSFGELMLRSMTYPTYPGIYPYYMRR